MSGARRASLHWFFVALVFALGVLSASAQASPTPITVGQNLAGTLSDPAASVQYALALGAPQSVTIQVLAITPGFAPTFRVLDPSGAVVFSAPTSTTQATAQGAPSLSGSGTYLIVVSSANASPGQFLISLQPGAPLAPPTPLTAGQPINGTVDAQTTRQAYSFSASASDVLLVTVTSADPTSGPVIALRDADSNDLLALDTARLAGASYRIPSGAANYLLEVTNGGSSSADAFTVCLASESGSPACPGSAAAQVALAPTATLFFLPTPTLLAFAPAVIDPGGACEVTPARDNSVNVRGGPGTGFAIVGSLLAGTTAPVIGRAPDNSWFEINAGGLGWVSASVVLVGGNCAGVSVVNLPTPIPPTNAPPQAPTEAATQMPTNAPTEAPTTAPTTGSSGSGSLHLPSHEVLLPTATTVPGTNFHLSPIEHFPLSVDPNATPGLEVNIGTGFLNHYQNGLLGGGAVNMSYLGGTCSGYADVAPTLRIHFYGGNAWSTLLRIGGASPDAAELIVSDPNNQFRCSNVISGVSGGVIDFGFPITGTYNVWVASIAPGVTVGVDTIVTNDPNESPF